MSTSNSYSQPHNAIVKHGEREQLSGLPLIRSLLEPLIFGALLATIALTAIPYGTVQPWWIAIFECVVFLIATLAVVETFIGGSWARFNLRLFVPLLVLTLFILFQSLPLFSRMGPLKLGAAISADPYGTGQFAIRLFALILISLLLLRYASTRIRLRNLIYLVVAVGVASALFGLARKGFQQNSGFLLPGLNPEDRGFAQFVNRNHFAFLMEMCLGLTLGLIIDAIGNHIRLAILVVVGAILWVALIYSNSRGGILSSLCQVLFLGVLLDPVGRFMKSRVETQRSRAQSLLGGLVLRIVLCVVLVGVFAYGVGWVGGEPVVFNLQRATTDFSQQETQYNANTSRKEIWAATWQLIKANPFVGVGFGGYWVAITRFHNASGAMAPQQAHNEYLELLASGGIVGLGLVVWFAVVFSRNVRPGLRSKDSFYRACCLGALTGIFGVAVHSFVDFGLHITINALVFFALITIAIQCSWLAAKGGQPGSRVGLVRRSETGTN